MSVLKAARLSKKPPLNRQELWQLWGKALFIKNAFPQIPPQKDSIWNSPANRLDN